MLQAGTIHEDHNESGSIRSLHFVSKPANPSSWVGAVRDLVRGGHRTIGARLLNDAANQIAPALAAEFGSSFSVVEKSGQTEIEESSGRPQRFDVTLLIGSDPEGVSSALLEYLDVAAVTLVAPVTARYHKNLPLYLISIPKAGTHLLFRLAEALGYAAGGIAPAQPKGGHWYYLLHSNAHTTTREFFHDELQRAPFGNRAHPFMRSPALFNYRNPFDILVSEANYWHVDGKSPLYSVLGHLSFEQRVARLVDDRWLLGSIRDRVGEFAAWLDCANVIPISFEEIVGDAGGGSNAAFDALVWSLQLKLHVPGTAEDILAAVSDRSSATFREGRINGWRQALPVGIISQIGTMPQDFMEAFGYDASSVLPRHIEAFRRRPLRLMSAAQLTVPYLVETDFLAHNIVSYRQRYYAVPLSAGALDLAQLSPEDISALLNGESLSWVRTGLIAREVKRQIASEREAGEGVIAVPPAPSGDERVGEFRAAGSFLTYNLFRRRDGVIAVPMRLGPVDPTKYELRFAPGVIAASGLVTAWTRILFTSLLGP